jgi:hypothetical protein
MSGYRIISEKSKHLAASQEIRKGFSANGFFLALGFDIM